MNELDNIPQKQSIEIESVKIEDSVKEKLEQLNQKQNIFINDFGQIYLRKKEIQAELDKEFGKEQPKFATNKSVGTPTTTPQQKKEVNKIIEFFNKQFGLDVFAPFSEFAGKLKSLGYDSLKAMVIYRTNVLGNTAKLKASKYYVAAKAGDINSAVNLIKEILSDKNIEIVKEKLAKYPNAIIAPVYAIEATGINKIPIALANKMASISGNKVDEDISQESKAFRTGSKRIERFNSYPQFEGEVVKGADYILVDDVSTDGTTLKSLKDHIEQNGGNVVETFVLGVGRRGNTLEPQSELKQILIDKFGEKELNLFLNETGRKNIEALTANEIQFLESFNSINAIREAGIEAFKIRSTKDIGESVQFLKTPSGKVLGFVSEGKIYLNPDALTPETTFHELTHVQQELIKIAAEQGDEKAKAVLRRWDKLLADNDVMSQMGKWDKTDTTLQAGVRKNVAIGAISLMTLINSGNVITKNNIQNTSVSEQEKSNWDLRADGTKKGNGYFGVLKMKDGSGKVASEISIGKHVIFSCSNKTCGVLREIAKT
jgi:orotate phosphoribosyltransferase